MQFPTFWKSFEVKDIDLGPWNEQGNCLNKLKSFS